MAKAFPIAHKRGTTFFANPKDLTIDESVNGRAFPYTEAEIYDKAKTLKKQGQLQPIVVRREGNKVLVVAGTGRALGGLYLNTNDPDYSAEPFLLECVVKDDDGTDARKQNVAENFKRKSLTPVDIAHNITLSDAEVAKAVKEADPEAVPTDAQLLEGVLDLFDLENNGDNRKWIERHRAIGTLSMGIKRKINSKTLAMDAALEYVGLEPATAEKVQAAAEAANPGHKVTKTRVRKAKATVAEAAPAKPISHAINKVQLITFLSYQVENNKRTATKTICNGLLGLLSGDLLEADMLKLFDKFTVPNPPAK